MDGADGLAGALGSMKPRVETVLRGAGASAARSADISAATLRASSHHRSTLAVISSWTSASVGTPLSAPSRVQLTAAAAFAVRSA